VSSQGKITGRKRNGNTAFYQRQLTNAVKRARFLALLPFIGE
jgi:small subunit ribosomal protein S18